MSQLDNSGWHKEEFPAAAAWQHNTDQRQQPVPTTTKTIFTAGPRWLYSGRAAAHPHSDGDLPSPQ